MRDLSLRSAKEQCSNGQRWNRTGITPCVPRPGLYLLVIWSGFLGGCLGPLYKNAPLEAFDARSGYRFDALELGSGNTDDLFICLTFSGGGTRAAAFSYGVLRGLRETAIPSNAQGGPARRMLDEVDIVSSVSGGSFTAAAWVLQRDRLFDGTFERRFLKSNIQSLLLKLILRPLNLLQLPWVVLDRIDLAASYYDTEIFHGGTYADLLRRNDRPFIVVNATDLSREQVFEFTQGSFDLLGSDLGSVPLGWSVAASSAFPLLLSPMRLKYHDGPAMSQALHAVVADDNEKTNDPPRRAWAKDLLVPRRASDRGPRPAFDVKRHKYLYLVDGGLADNLGLTYVIRAYRSGEIRRLVEARKIKRLMVIVVDVGTNPPQDIESQSSAPGLLRVGYKTAITSMRNYSKALIAIIKHLMVEDTRVCEQVADSYETVFKTHCPDAPKPSPRAIDAVEQYLIVLDFKRIADQAERERFLSMRTSFFLPPSDVDDLIGMGRTMILDHPEYQRLIREIHRPENTISDVTAPSHNP